MKILYISPRYEGGIGGHAKRVAEKLSEQGHDVKLMQIPHIPIKKLNLNNYQNLNNLLIIW